MTNLLTNEVLHAIDRSVLCWLSTVSDKGIPSVSPKEIFTVVDDLIVIANVKSPNSARNIAANSNVCVAFLDILVQKGFQVFGEAEVIKKDASDFQRLADPLIQMTQGKFPFATLFKVSVTKVKPIIAPRYVLYPETTESEQIASAIKTYGFENQEIKEPASEKLC